MARLLLLRFPLILLAAGGAARADDAAIIPACALSGASTVMFSGKPALKLSDVVHCPAELYEIIPGIQIEGQPLVIVKTGATEAGTCVTQADGTVVANGKAVQGVGDVVCKSK